MTYSLNRKTKKTKKAKKISMKTKKSRIYEQKDIFTTLMTVFDMEIAPYMYDLKKTITKEFTGEKEKEMWIAKNRATNEEYGKTYDSIMDCQNYIDTKLKVLNKFYKLVEEEKRDLFKTNYNGANIIQCYNKEQKRWCDGFDF